MPRKKDLKRLTRSRMQKTGESYTTARVRLLDQRRRSEESPPPQPAPTAEKLDHAALAGMSDAAVNARTGRIWEAWVEVLDAEEASEWPHREIAAYLEATHELSGWWAQAVTVGYERIKGRRAIGQRRSGHYEANKSKTFSVPLARLYRAWGDRRLRGQWLPGVDLIVRKATPERSMRITWGDGTSVDLWFSAKGESKSQVQVQHSKLASKTAAEERKDFWADRLTALEALLRR